MSGSESSARTLGLFAMDTNQVEKAAFGSDGLETQQLTRRIIALKEAVLSNDQAIAALTGGASASASDAVGTREVASGGWNATDPKSLTAVLKAQLAELHEVLQDKERAIQALRLKASFCCSASKARLVARVSRPGRIQSGVPSLSGTLAAGTAACPHSGALHALGRARAPDTRLHRGGGQAAPAHRRV